MPAEMGHATGAGIDVRTRAASNQLHGSGFDYLQSGGLDARNFFDGADRPSLVQNQFGGTAGGALRRNSWFVFGGAESSRERSGLTVISTVPTAAEKAGMFPAPVYNPLSIVQVTGTEFVRTPFPANLIPASAISTVARNLAALYPAPNLPGLVNNYRFTPAADRDTDRFDVRVDRTSEGKMLFVRFNYGRQYDRAPGALPAVDGMPQGSYAGSDPAQHADATVNKPATWAAAIGETRAMRQNIVNDFRAGVSQLNLYSQASDSGWNTAAGLGIPGLSAAGLPSVQLLGYARLGATGPAPFDLRTTSFQAQDTVSWSTRRHSWRFGLQAIERRVDGDASEWTSRGTYLFTPDYTGQQTIAGTGDAIASLLTGFPAEIRRDAQFAPYHLRGFEWSGFVQDSVRLRSNLALELGLRASLYPPIEETGNRMVNFNFSDTAPAVDLFAGQSGVNRYGGISQKRAIAPRIGFAWDLRGDGHTVLRGGFTKTADTGTYLVEGALARNQPYASRLDLFEGTLQVGPKLSDGLPAAVSRPLSSVADLNASGNVFYALQRSAYTPYADQWGLFLERRMRRDLMLEIGGSGSMGIHLMAAYDLNAPYPAPTPYNSRRWPYEPYRSRIDFLGFAGGSTYYGGQARLTGTPSRGVRMMLLYRFAKALDDAAEPLADQQSRPPGYQYIYYPRGSRSLSTFDIRQKLTATVFYELPLRKPAGGVLRRIASDWRVGAVITAQSGLPFTPQLATNTLNNGGYQLPNRVGDGSLPADQRSYLHWFNTSLDASDPSHAFEAPALFQYGNSGMDILRGPGLATVDTSFSRTIPIREGLHVSTRLELFNALNHTNFGLPNRLLGTPSSGAIDHTSTAARSVQVVARVEW
jgi:hypothetical protein